MKLEKAIFFALLLTSTQGLNAQETVTTTGGEATGTGGTTSYSIGQVVYTTQEGANGSVSQGVQQPYEISTTVGIDETSIKLEMSVFPNPTTDFLILKTEEIDGLTYQLIDMQGKLIETNKVSINSTTIEMDKLASATYFLIVTKNNNPVKTFKIIKNQ